MLLCPELEDCGEEDWRLLELPAEEDSDTDPDDAACRRARRATCPMKPRPQPPLLVPEPLSGTDPDSEPLSEPDLLGEPDSLLGLLLSGENDEDLPEELLPSADDGEDGDDEDEGVNGEEETDEDNPPELLLIPELAALSPCARATAPWAWATEPLSHGSPQPVAAGRLSRSRLVRRRAAPAGPWSVDVSHPLPTKPVPHDPHLMPTATARAVPHAGSGSVRMNRTVSS